MSWYRYDDGERPAHRYPVTVDLTSWSSGPQDIAIALASHGDLDLFWDMVQSDSFDIIPTQADGSTAFTFDIQSFNSTTRAGIVQLDAYTPGTAGVHLVWLYFGHPSDGASDEGASPTIASAATGTIHRADPTSVPQHLVKLANRRPTQSQPSQTVALDTGEVIRVFVDCTDALQRRSRMTTSQSSDRFEEPKFATYSIDDSQDNDVPGMYDVTSGRWHTDDNGRIYFSFEVDGSGASSGTEYTAIVSITTSDDRVLVARPGISVRDVLGS